MSPYYFYRWRREGRLQGKNEQKFYFDFGEQTVIFVIAQNFLEFLLEIVLKIWGI